MESDKPDLRHRKLDYQECWAKILLERYFPEEYSNLELSDRPDLLDKLHHIGIEVTNAVPEKEQRAISLASRIPYDQEKIKQKNLALLDKEDYKYTDYGLFHPSQSWSWNNRDRLDFSCTPYQLLFDIVRKKVALLNSKNYKNYPRYDLYVRSELFIMNDFLPDIIEELFAINVGARSYTMIYLLTLEDIVCFDMVQKTYRCVEIKGKLNDIGPLAMKMVEGAENDKT